MNLFVMEWREVTRVAGEEWVCLEAGQRSGMSPYPANLSKKDAAEDMLALALGLRGEDGSRTWQIQFADERSVPPPDKWEAVIVIFDDTDERVTNARTPV